MEEARGIMEEGMHQEVGSMRKVERENDVGGSQRLRREGLAACLHSWVEVVGGGRRVGNADDSAAEV